MKMFFNRNEPARSIPSRLDRDPEYEKWKHLESDIEYLVIVTEEFIVYVDKALDVDWSVRGDAVDSGKCEQGEFNAVLNRVAALETIPCDELARGMKLHFKRLLGEGVARALEADFKGAQSILSSAEKYIDARSAETSRYWYLSGSTLMVVAFVAIGIVFWLWRSGIESKIGSLAFLEALCACAGALGAQLSVIGRAGKQHFDCSAGKRLHYLEAASRIWAGSISGILVGMAVHAQIFLTAITHDGNLPAVMVLAALASGVSERLAVPIIADLGAHKSTKEEEKAQ